MTIIIIIITTIIIYNKKLTSTEHLNVNSSSTSYVLFGLYGVTDTIRLRVAAGNKSTHFIYISLSNVIRQR